MKKLKKQQEYFYEVQEPILRSLIWDKLEWASKCFSFGGS